MKRVKYKFHPEEYELGENEKFYSDMEEKGWRLVKRGTYLSKFTPVEPSRARYRIEVSAPGFLEEPNMSEAQLAVFADCGWEYVADRGLLYIFRAPAGSDAPEFYAEPSQQAATLKRMRAGAVWGWVPCAALALWMLVMQISLGGGAGRFGADVLKTWVTWTALMAGFAAMTLWGLYHAARQVWSVTRTYRRLKKGIPLDHAPKNRRLVHRAVNWTLIAVMAVCALLTAAEMLEARSGDLPEEPDGPYIVLSDLGWDGEREPFMNRESGITRYRSLLADCWEVTEFKNGVYIFQNVYRLRSPEKAMEFARTLMVNSTFGRSVEAFAPVEVPGLDGAWAAERLETVAVQGEYAAYITYIVSGPYDEDLTPVLTALAERWKQSP